MGISYAPGSYLVLATIESTTQDGHADHRTIFDIATVEVSASDISFEDIVDMLLHDTETRLDQTKFVYVAPMHEYKRPGLYLVSLTLASRATDTERSFRFYTLLDANHTIFDTLTNLKSILSPTLGIVGFSYSHERAI